MVRAKFQVSHITEFAGNWGGQPCVAREVNASAVTSYSDPEGTNKEWATATPSGSLKITIQNPAAHQMFKPGSVFYIDFTDATPSGSK
jgi:hypothetical protein